MNNVTLALRNELNMSEKSSTSESNSGESDSAANDIEEWEEKIETPAADFVDNMPPPSIRDELQPIDYFYCIFGKQSTTLLTNQSNLYSVQKNLNKPVRISETEMKISKEEKLSIGEQIIPFKGKSIMQQHMPNKPNRWGYKMFLLAGGNSSICYDFIFYTGKNDKKKYGFCTDIVLGLCETVPRLINSKVYFDNYFTTIR
ncbi:unnamed protein product [Rotaria sordida]|uniref:PiggyBac transposable element-derived protein domain-containing protein n=1 Tax=Rotaria sordida TaxID=392033 RepID=A0A816GEF5_9BILA|nr:unnamed protein product [Rotaria sordida]CAF1673053.1 unnamed protein product [Rotaria sordida]